MESVELKLAGEYVWCEVLSRTPRTVTVLLPSGCSKTFPVERVMGESR